MVAAECIEADRFLGMWLSQRPRQGRGYLAQGLTLARMICRHILMI
jgi:hypothetical protein